MFSKLKQQLIRERAKGLVNEGKENQAGIRTGRNNTRRMETFYDVLSKRHGRILENLRRQQQHVCNGSNR